MTQDFTLDVRNYVFYYLKKWKIMCRFCRQSGNTCHMMLGLYGMASLWVRIWKKTHYYGNEVWLTHWGWVTHIGISQLATIGSDNGLSSGRSQAIIWTNAGILLIGPLGTKFSEIVIKMKTFSLTKLHLKMSSADVAAIFSWPQYMVNEISLVDMLCLGNKQKL